MEIRRCGLLAGVVVVEDVVMVLYLCFLVTNEKVVTIGR